MEQITITLPILAPGETYAGLILNDEGTPTHHLILAAGDEADLTWEQAKAFAEKAGGELPTRQEQSLLFANCKKQFEEDWYWSGEQHASYAGYAWYQYFGSGGQGFNHFDDELRARAVRRLPICPFTHSSI